MLQLTSLFIAFLCIFPLIGCKKKSVHKKEKSKEKTKAPAAVKKADSKTKAKTATATATISKTTESTTNSADSKASSPHPSTANAAEITRWIPFPEPAVEPEKPQKHENEVAPKQKLSQEKDKEKEKEKDKGSSKKIVKPKPNAKPKNNSKPKLKKDHHHEKKLKIKTVESAAMLGPTCGKDATKPKPKVSNKKSMYVEEAVKKEEAKGKPSPIHKNQSQDTLNRTQNSNENLQESSAKRHRDQLKPGEVNEYSDDTIEDAPAVPRKEGASFDAQSQENLAMKTSNDKVALVKAKSDGKQKTS